MTNERAVELLRRLQDEQFDGIHGDERREALEMAIRAMEEPKTAGSGSADSEQPEIKTDRTIGDSINRQQAIEAVRNAEYRFRIKSDSYFKDYVEEMREIAKQITDAHAKALEDLPPAERPRFWIDSEGKLSALPSGQIATDTNVGDTISRQQAIGSIARWIGYLDEDMICRIQIGLKRLPPAQHDAKTCAGCYFEKHGSRACDHCSRMYMDRYEVRNDG